ncbi:hypothetical protein RHMOL_Rhmol09G0183900 [Rhododendron molle]|uniref:Uncharacterized protein n=1 Tax=Rhododendron molle TaxID=49168 RepID=A0ACC0MFV6_RHOML|nr:hypothetical protein RHMOL_Rhmol09G0183900 [Rhododendron molle]
MMQQGMKVNSSVGVLISGINRFMRCVGELEVSFERRSANSVAHCVAKNAVGGSGCRTWMMVVIFHSGDERLP